MKFMTFRASCAYAGVANMLEQYGIETDDRSIALGMKLPYLFSCKDGVYLAGPMLQSAEWFDLYLNPLGYRMVETIVDHDDLADYLKRQKTAMLGLKVDGTHKHAVVYVGCQDDRLIFINNKWEAEQSPAVISHTESTLKEAIGREAVVATLHAIVPVPVDFSSYLLESVQFIEHNLVSIRALCQGEKTIEALRGKMDSIFRPLLLDGITMLDLIGETELAGEFRKLQRALLDVLCQNPKQRIVLRDHLSLETLACAAEQYIALIKEQARLNA